MINPGAALKLLSKQAVKNAPTILTIVGVGGVIASVATAIDATPKAIKLLEEEREQRWQEDPENYEELNGWDVVKTTWKCYIPTVIFGSLTIASIVSSNTINLKRNAAIASAYAVVDKSYKEYKNAVHREYGSTGHAKVKNAVYEDKINNIPTEMKSNIFNTSGGSVLTYDCASGRLLRTSRARVERIENDLSRRLRREMNVSLNDLYDELEIPRINLGDELGWNADDDDEIKINFGSQLLDGEPVMTLDYDFSPKFRYWG